MEDVLPRFRFACLGPRCDFDTSSLGTEVGSITKGGSFGELALLYFAPRAVTIQVFSASIVANVTRTYSRSKRKHKKTKRKIYLGSPSFRNFGHPMISLGLARPMSNPHRSGMFSRYGLICPESIRLCRRNFDKRPNRNYSPRFLGGM